MAIHTTSRGYIACRRCDDCGTRTDIRADDEKTCILECSRCGKEYPFHTGSADEAAQNQPKK